jgi:hypothetical protein
MVFVSVNGKADRGDGWIERHGPRDYRSFVRYRDDHNHVSPTVRSPSLQDAAVAVARRLHPWRRRWDLVMPFSADR